tara:strand:- start:84 stop:338 length:255 start_codon:yes stop_codon:yes gene_type:complete
MTERKAFYTSLLVLPVLLSIAGGTVAVEMRYAKQKQMIDLISSNAQQIAILKIETAKQSKNKNLLRRLCDDFKRLHNWRPSACK